ncbi:hypothetical protein B0H14DRAFT_2584656 [Mycena olivaceomarginata]|nr:hypothetical protein B0H14DRAFT_2584656 [Mycena olivaceomarginata]
MNDVGDRSAPSTHLLHDITFPVRPLPYFRPLYIPDNPRRFHALRLFKFKFSLPRGGRSRERGAVPGSHQIPQGHVLFDKHIYPDSVMHASQPPPAISDASEDNQHLD